MSRRPTPRCGATLLAVLLCVGHLVSATPGHAEENVAFSGVVRNHAGQVLDQVEVLIATQASAIKPIAVARSGPNGQFAIAALVPGTYRIAALKQGYLTYIAQIDTRAQKWINVVLRPMPETVGESGAPLPRDHSWVLRLPQRSILRETEAGAPLEADAALDPQRRAANGGVLAASPVRLEFEQLFAINAPIGANSASPSEMQGTETHLRLASALGERGNIRLRGSRESFGSHGAAQSRGDADETDLESASLNVDFRYDTGPDGRIAIQAYYNEHELGWMRGPSELPAPGRSAQQSWGYQSEWMQQLDPSSSIAVKMKFKDSSIMLPAHAGNDHPRLSGRADDDPVLNQTHSNQALSAGTTYESVLDDGHQIEVDVHAETVESPWLIRDSEPAGDRGWNLQMSAQDSWSVSVPFTLVYGVGYRHATGLMDAGMFVPQIGGRWADEHVMLSLAVSYHSLVGSAPAPIRRLEVFRPEREIGYEAEIEVPLAPGLRLRGSTSYAPMQFDDSAFDGGLGHAGQPYYVTNGEASLARGAISLIQEIGTMRTYVELVRGRVEGMLGATATFDGPYQIISPGELTYNSGRWGVQLLPSGTDLQIEYRRLVDWNKDDHRAGADTERETLELRLVQDLLRAQAAGNWRLLMAVRMALVEDDHKSDWTTVANAPNTEAFNRGVTAGLSVKF